MFRGLGAQKVGAAVISAVMGLAFLSTVPAQAAQPSPIAATKANADEIHMKARGKSCPDDFTLAKAKGTHKVTWKWPNRTGEKTLKKGKFACMFTGKDGVTQQGKFDKDGVLVALPSNFPKNPTAEDIASLGLTPTTKVAPDLRIPAPKAGSEFEPAALPETVEVVAYHDDFVYEKYFPETLALMPDAATGTWTMQVDQVERTERYHLLEIEYHGGDGLILVGRSYNPKTNTVVENQWVELNPDKVTTVYDAVPAPSMWNEGSTFSGQGGNDWVSSRAGGIVYPDYGQGNLPESMVRDWDKKTADGGIFERRAMSPGEDPSNFYETSAGVHVKSWVSDSTIRQDGFYRYDNAGRMIGYDGKPIPNYTRSALTDHPRPWENSPYYQPKQ